MKLPAAAYSAEVATSATKAGSYGVFGEGESCRHRHRDLTTMPSVINITILVESMGPSRMLKKGGWGSWDDPRARATRGLRRPSLDARSWDHPTHPLVSDRSLRPCPRNGASWRAGVGRVRSL